MKISTPETQKFLIDVIKQVSFPGDIVEFVAQVKAEIASAEIENTASTRMLNHQENGNI